MSGLTSKSSSASNSLFIYNAILAIFTVTLLLQFNRELKETYASALMQFQLLQHASSNGIARHVEANFRQMHQGLRTIARLPGVRGLKTSAPSLPLDASVSILELYKNLAENVSLSELYIVPVSFDPESLDPNTGKLQRPLLTFDDLIVGRNADQSTATLPRVVEAGQAEEIEIYEYREMQRQIAWFKARYPNEASVAAIAYPAITSRELVTCDNTRYSPVTPNDKDRSGIVYSVPIYDLNGLLSGIVSAVILTDVLSEILPDGYHALQNADLDVVAGLKWDDFWKQNISGLASTAQADPLSYSESVSLNLSDVSKGWRLWSGMPAQAFKESAEAGIAVEWYRFKVIVLLVLASIIAVGLSRQISQHETIADRNRELESRIRERTMALESAKSEAERASTAKSQFLASVSHEIRTPMHAIISAADLLAVSKLNDLVAGKVGIIRSASRALLGLVNQVLDLAAIEHGRIELALETFSPSALVSETCEMLRPSANMKSLDLRSEITSGLPSVLVADAVRIRQVLINLVGNAIKFTDEGHVLVRLGPVVANATAAPQMDIQVIDTGRGIGPQQRETLFQPFGRSGSHSARGAVLATEGAGLGLAISKQLVDLMGGQLKLEATSEGGACFRFTVPYLLASEDAGQPALEARPIPVDAVPAIGARVLLAEDHPVMQQLTRELLERLGCDVTLAGNGLEAVELTAHTRFDIVLMDSRMPELDGLAATRRIRQCEAASGAPPVPIIALTANAFATDRAHCLDSGMTDFLSKPLALATLSEALQRNLPSLASR